MTIIEFTHMLQPVIHYTLHLLFPGLIAWIFFKNQWKKAWLIMLATMLVDLDHLFAYPDVFMPDRCGIGFHLLHSYYAIAGYTALVFISKTRIIGVGLLFHMLTDFQDCLWVKSNSLF